MSRLLVFRSFAHDPQGVLAAVQLFALVGVKLYLHVLALELSATSFANTKPLFHDPQFALRHDFSLAHLAWRQ
jgi:hypothetical protein